MIPQTTIANNNRGKTGLANKKGSLVFGSGGASRKNSLNPQLDYRFESLQQQN